MTDAVTDAKTSPRDRKVKQVVRPRSWRSIWEYVRAIGLAVLLALVIRQVIIQAFRIPTGSMEKTLLVGDYLFVNKFLYGAKTPDRIRLLGHTLVEGLPVLKLPALRQPRQGDIIVFQYPRDPNLDYIKRCVAVAGDTVQVRDGMLYVNGAVYESNFSDRDGDHSCVPDWRRPDACPKPRTYHDPGAFRTGSPLNRAYGPVAVPAGHLFMMGDNRYNSADSRYWGPLDVDLIKGKAMVIYFSWDHDKFRPRLNRIGDLIR
ncbi:MAG: signal peptidase I [bacterium]